MGNFLGNVLQIVSVKILRKIVIEIQIVYSYLEDRAKSTQLKQTVVGSKKKSLPTGTRIENEQGLSIVPIQVCCRPYSQSTHVAKAYFQRYHSYIT